MPKQKPMSLSDARRRNDLEGFIKQHERDPKGDLDRLERAIKRSPSSGKSSEAPKASSRRDRDD